MSAGDEAQLFQEILSAPDRDHCPGSLPVISYRDDDQASFLDEVDVHSTCRVTLERRGRYHGEFAELKAEHLLATNGAPVDAIYAQRWHSGRPIVLRGLFDPGEACPEEVASRRRLHDELKEVGGLKSFLKSERPQLEPHFSLHTGPSVPFDRERDIERVQLNWIRVPADPSSHQVRDLWLKSAWLSDRDDDESMRVRFSFGREVHDDASRDFWRHRRVGELARLLLPEAVLIEDHPRIAQLVGDLLGDEAFFTQHIAYWNAPGGGALFHHDAFREDVVGGQRGVCYAQFSGETMWLALSIEDLTRRVIEFLGYLNDGELPWVREQLAGKPGQFDTWMKMCERFPKVRRELGLPGCGRFAGLVNRGPEFSTFLADAGHAYLLRPGDVMLMANHGLENTVMHSVFCASAEPAYALSMAIREKNPPKPPEKERESNHPGQRGGQGRARKRRQGPGGLGREQRRRRQGGRGFGSD